MGYYIQVPENKGKAQQIVNLYGGRIVEQPLSFTEKKLNEAVICVIDNGMFEAAAFCYSQEELDYFINDNTGRAKTWVVMGWDTACNLTNYRV